MNGEQAEALAREILDRAPVERAFVLEDPHYHEQAIILHVLPRDGSFDVVDIEMDGTTQEVGP